MLVIIPGPACAQIFFAKEAPISHDAASDLLNAQFQKRLSPAVEYFICTPSMKPSRKCRIADTPDDQVPVEQSVPDFAIRVKVRSIAKFGTEQNQGRGSGEELHVRGGDEKLFVIRSEEITPIRK